MVSRASQLVWSLLLLNVCAPRVALQSAFIEEGMFNLQFVFVLPTLSYILYALRFLSRGENE